MTDVPQFNLTASNIDFATDEALQAELEKTGGQYFDAPGNYDLTISAAEFHKNKETGSIYCKGDATWFNVKITLASADGKAIDHWLQVPTTDIKFGEKKTLAVFRKFQQFLFGIGEAVTIEKLNALCQKYFANPAKLVGQKVNCDLGYEGPYVHKQADDVYVVMVKGKPMQEDGADVSLPDRSSAVQYAKSQGVEPSFIRVLKFTAKKAVAKAKLKAASDTEW
jgi:hypothetical protein